MDVRIYGELREQCPDVQLTVLNIHQVLAGLKQIHGAEVVSHLMTNKYYYLLGTTDGSGEIVDMVPLIEGLLTMDIQQFDVLFIVPEVSGDVVGTIIVTAIVSAAFAATTAGLIIAAVINIAIAIALAFLMQMLSPTPEFDSDPSEAQRKESSLYNGAPNIREQGGSVPYACGQCRAGGVLISSGLYAEDV